MLRLESYSDGWTFFYLHTLELNLTDPQGCWSHLSIPFTLGCSVLLYSQVREEVSFEMRGPFKRHFFMIEINMLMETLDAAEIFPLCLCVILFVSARDRSLDHMTWCLRWYVLSAILSFKIMLPQLNWHRWSPSLPTSVKEKKKKPLCYVFCPIICATCTYSSNRHATHFQKQLQTLKRKLKKGEWTYSVVTGHYGSSWGSYGAHVQIYPLINIYEGCTHSRNSLFAAMSSPDFSPLNTSHSPPHNQLFLCLTPFNPTCL